MKVREANRANWEKLKKTALKNDQRKEMNQKCLEDLLQISFEMDQAVQAGHDDVPRLRVLEWLDRMNISLIVELTGRYDLWKSHTDKKELSAGETAGEADKK